MSNWYLDPVRDDFYQIFVGLFEDRLAAERDRFGFGSSNYLAFNRHVRFLNTAQWEPIKEIVVASTPEGVIQLRLEAVDVFKERLLSIFNRWLNNANILDDQIVLMTGQSEYHKRSLFVFTFANHVKFTQFINSLSEINREMAQEIFCPEIILEFIQIAAFISTISTHAEEENALYRHRIPKLPSLYHDFSNPEREHSTELVDLLNKHKMQGMLPEPAYEEFIHLLTDGVDTNQFDSLDGRRPIYIAVEWYDDIRILEHSSLLSWRSDIKT